MQKRELIAITGITLFGLGLRIIFLLAMKANWPGWDSPTIDALYHHLWALKIADGDILGGGPYFRAPLYPLFLGSLYALFGAKIGLAILIQHLIGALTIPLVYVAAKRYFSMSVALISAFLTAVNGVLIYFESQLLLDFLTVTFMIILLLLLDSAYSKRRSIYFLSAGIMAGLFAITRPNILAIIPLIMLWIFLFKGSIKNKIKYSILIILGAILIVIPVTIRNAVIGGDSVLIASQGGINFYIGNNEQADGMTALLPGFGHTWQYSDAAYEASSHLEKKPDKIKPSEVSSYYYKKALNFIISQPWQFIKLMFKKLYMFWNYFEISNNNNLYFLASFIGMSFIPLFLFAVISPLGIVGALLCFFKDRRYWILPIIIFGYMLTIIAFFVTGRFRIPLIPLLTITAVFAISEIYYYIRDKNYPLSVILISCVLILGIFTWTNMYDHHDQSMAMAHYSLGNMLMKKGDYEKAKQEYQTALGNKGCVPNASLNLGVIAFYEKDIKTAEKYFADELNICGPNAKAYNNLSMLSRLNDEFDFAIAWADSAIDHYPNFKEAYINRILATFAADDSLAIKKSIEQFSSIFPDNAAAAYYMGLFLYQQDDINASEKYFKKVVTAGDKDIVSEYDLSEIYSSSLPYGYDPRKIKGKSYYQLGLIQAGKNNLPSVLENFRQAVTLMPDDPDALANLALAYDQTGDYEKAISYFDQAISVDSTNALYYFNYAMTLGKTGEYGRSMTMLEKAVNLNPEFIQAKQVLEALKERLGNSPAN